MWLLLHPMTMSRFKLPYQAFRPVHVCQSATQPFLVTSRNAPPRWGGALRDDTKDGCVADYTWAGNSRSYTFSHNGWEAETAKTAWSSLTVRQFFMKRAKEANIIATRVSWMSGFENWKTPYKVKKENLVSLPLTGAACKTVEIVDPWDTDVLDYRLIQTRTRRAWKGFWFVCLFVFFALSRVIFIGVS